MRKIEFTSEERTLLLLYLEDTRAQTIANLAKMRKELTQAEKELFLLASNVIDKLEELSDNEFMDLDLLSELSL